MVEWYSSISIGENKLRQAYVPMTFIQRTRYSKLLTMIAFQLVNSLPIFVWL